jgi:hypothetical protein
MSRWPRVMRCSKYGAWVAWKLDDGAMIIQNNEVIDQRLPGLFS